MRFCSTYAHAHISAFTRIHICRMRRFRGPRHALRVERKLRWLKTCSVARRRSRSSPLPPLLMPACSGATMSIAPIAIPLSTISAAVLDAFLVEIGWLPCASGQVSLQACGMSLTSTPCVPLELGSLASSLARTRTDRAHPDAALTKAPRRSDVATLFCFSGMLPSSGPFPAGPFHWIVAYSSGNPPAFAPL